MVNSAEIQCESTVTILLLCPDAELEVAVLQSHYDCLLKQVDGLA